MYLNMESKILKPPALYDRVKVERLMRMSINQRFYEQWSVKEAQVWDSERRMKENGCKVCTTSKYSQPDGADEWITYNHKHYSSLHDRINWYENNDTGPMYKCTPCKKMHLVRDAERVPIIVTSNSIYKWWEMEKRQDGMHVDYIQIPGATVKELFLALKTEYMMELRPMDVLVISGEIDTTWSTGDSIYTGLQTIRTWVLKKNKDNTCVFSAIPTIPHDVTGAPALSILKMRTHDLNERIMRQNQIIGSTPPKFNTWGVKETGYGENVRPRFKNSDWEEVLLGENTKGCNAKCFSKAKTLSQGRACMTWFRIKYELEMPVEKVIQNDRTSEEKRIHRNIGRMARRKRAKARRRDAAAEHNAATEHREEETENPSEEPVNMEEGSTSQQ